MTTLTLNGATLQQGDRIDFLRLTFSNRTSLEDGHPLKASGFSTAGYTVRFVAKPDITLADDGTGVIAATLAVIDADNASLLLLPSVTSGINFGTKSTIKYQWHAQVSDGSDYVYTLASGWFTLARDVAITA